MQDGPRSPFRNPVAHDSNWNLGGLTNGVSNTIDDIFNPGGIVSDNAWVAGDHRRSARERALAAAKVVGFTALSAGAGGATLSRVCNVAKRGIRYARKGREIVIKNGGRFGLKNGDRIAPFGNRTGHKYGRWTHYHRRGEKLPNGQTRPGQSRDRHRPFEPSKFDKSWRERF